MNTATKKGSKAGILKGLKEGRTSPTKATTAEKVSVGRPALKEPRITQSVRVMPAIVAKYKTLAIIDNRNINNLLETALLEYLPIMETKYGVVWDEKLNDYIPA